MKYYLLIVIVTILLAYSDAEDKEKLGYKTIEKKKNHMRKVRGLLRNLDTADDDDDDEDSTDEEGSANDEDPNAGNTTQPVIVVPTTAPAIQTTPKTTGRRYAAVQLIGFNNFQAPPTKILFKTYFVYINIRPARWVIIMIAINYRRGLRNLEETASPANCTIDPADANKPDGIARYNCDAPRDSSIVVNEVSVINVTFQNSTLSMDDINYSEEAALQASQLSKQTDTISQFLNLTNGILNINSPYIYINGQIEGYDGKVGDDGLILTVADKSKGTTYKVPCKIQSVSNNNNYRFRCTPEGNVTGSILYSTIKGQNKSIYLNMTENNDYINYYTANSGSDSTIDRGYAAYRKSSSGLSGGAIAGIVIACVFALIIASIIALMMRKSRVVAPMQPQSSSVIGLRSIDNYPQ